MISLLAILLMISPGFIWYVSLVHTSGFVLSLNNITKPLLLIITYALLSNWFSFWFFGHHGLKLGFIIKAAFHMSFENINIIEVLNDALIITFSQGMVAFCFGKVVKYVIKLSKFDRKYEYFRFIGNQWDYYFSNADSDHQYKNSKQKFTGVSAIVDYNHGTYLYTGILKRFTLDGNNQLDLIELEFSMRRELCESTDKPRGVKGDNMLDRFYPIDGGSLFLRYSEIKTINLRFMELNKKKGNS